MYIATSRPVEGHVTRGFEAVREAFDGNFARRHELGGACCAYHRGEKVVDLWGGVRNRQTGEPWERDTMVIVYSATKGLAAMTLAVAHSRGWLDYEERVRHTGLSSRSKAKAITARQLLAHCGLFALTSRWPQRRRRSRSAGVAGRLRNRAGKPGTPGLSRHHLATTNCRAVSIRAVAAWSPFRTRSHRRPGSTSHPAAGKHPELEAGHDCPARRLEMLLGFPLRLTPDDESRLRDPVRGSEFPRH